MGKAGSSHCQNVQVGSFPLLWKFHSGTQWNMSLWNNFHREGIPVSWTQEKSLDKVHIRGEWARYVFTIKVFPITITIKVLLLIISRHANAEMNATFHNKAGQPWREGDVYTRPKYAETLEVFLVLTSLIHWLILWRNSWLMIRLWLRQATRGRKTLASIQAGQTNIILENVIQICTGRSSIIFSSQAWSCYKKEHLCSLPLSS